MMQNENTSITFRRKRDEPCINSLIKNRKILWAGNRKLNIYGKLNCKSGTRMKTQNRVFFQNEQEAIALGFRPCGHCMRLEYLDWKMSNTFNKSSD